MNRENILKLALVLEDLTDDRFDISHWVSESSSGMENDRLSISDCGTAGCVAGWALAIKHNGVVELYDGCESDRDEYGLEEYSYPYSSVPHRAAEWLGLPKAFADKIFYPDYQSVWHMYRNDYQLEPSSPTSEFYNNIHPKYAADILHRILNGEFDDEIEDCESELF